MRSQYSSELKLLGFLALPCKSIRQCYTRPIPRFRLVLPQAIAHHPAPATTAIKELDFTLSVDQRTHFTLVDDEVLDNRGGVSVRIEYLPEPTSGMMLASGAALLGFLSRRHSRRSASV